MTTRIHIQEIQLNGFAFGPRDRKAFEDSFVAALASSIAPTTRGRLSPPFSAPALRDPRGPVSAASAVALAVREKVSR